MKGRIFLPVFLITGLLFLILAIQVISENKLDNEILIGDIVRLEVNNKKVDVLIIGYKQQNPESEEIYDYTGVDAYTGYISDEYTYLFNKDQIVNKVSGKISIRKAQFDKHKEIEEWGDSSEQQQLK